MAFDIIEVDPVLAVLLPIYGGEKGEALLVFMSTLGLLFGHSQSPNLNKLIQSISVTAE
jgi:hypothetical protein